MPTNLYATLPHDNFDAYQQSLNDCLVHIESEDNWYKMSDYNKPFNDLVKSGGVYKDNALFPKLMSDMVERIQNIKSRNTYERLGKEALHDLLHPVLLIHHVSANVPKACLLEEGFLSFYEDQADGISTRLKTGQSLTDEIIVSTAFLENQLTMDEKGQAEIEDFKRELEEQINDRIAHQQRYLDMLKNGNTNHIPREENRDLADIAQLVEFKQRVLSNI
jgi:hypothetical protein